jgi:hypothetical protein
MGKRKFVKGSRDTQEQHGETCQCRRCRARAEALDRRPVKFRITDHNIHTSRNTEDEK